MNDFPAAACYLVTLLFVLSTMISMGFGLTSGKSFGH
jgi:hypothetical protein